MTSPSFVTVQIQERLDKNGVPIYDEVYKFSGVNAASDAIILIQMKYGIPPRGVKR
jgi:hypothetical protein